MATDRTATGLSYVPAPKTKLPGHEESYNPPKEYLPSEVGPLLHQLHQPTVQIAFACVLAKQVPEH